MTLVNCLNGPVLCHFHKIQVQPLEKTLLKYILDN